MNNDLYIPEPTTGEMIAFRFAHAAKLRAQKGTKSGFAAMFMPHLTTEDIDVIRERQASETEAEAAEMATGL